MNFHHDQECELVQGLQAGKKKKEEELKVTHKKVKDSLETALASKVQRVKMRDQITNSPVALIQFAYGMPPTIPRWMKTQNVFSVFPFSFFVLLLLDCHKGDVFFSLIVTNRKEKGSVEGGSFAWRGGTRVEFLALSRQQYNNNRRGCGTKQIRGEARQRRVGQACGITSLVSTT